MPLNLGLLEPFRLRDLDDFRTRCNTPGTLIAVVRTDNNGLVLHHPACTFLQDTLERDNTDFTTFYAVLKRAGVRLFFTCPKLACQELHGQLQRLYRIP